MPTQTEQQILNQLAIIQEWINNVDSNKKQIHQFNNTDSVSDSDLVPVSKSGTTYKTAISNLLALVSTDQDNINLVKGFTTASSSFTDMVAGINALSPYTINDKQTVFFQTSIIDPDDVLNTAIITLATRDVGKGTYGSGETTLTGKLWIVGTRRLAYGDAEIQPDTQIINLGTHTSTTVEAVFNAAAEFTVQAPTAGLRLVNITLDAVEKQYFFTGIGGDYGTGGDLTATADQFDEITGGTNPPLSNPLIEELRGTTVYESITGDTDIDLDLTSFYSRYITTDDDLEINFLNTPAEGFAFKRRIELVIPTTKVLTIPSATILGDYVADGSTVNQIDLFFANYETEGLTTVAIINGGSSSSGTVTSVAVSGSDGIEVDSGSPITSNGTIALGVDAATLRAHLNVDESYTINIFDFLTDATTKAEVLANDTGQDSSITGEAFDDAFDYCIANGIKKLYVPSGTYVIDKVTVNALSNFILDGDGAVLMNGTGNAIFEFTACVNWEIRGFNFTSDAVAYADVAFLRISTNSGFFNIHNNIFSNMPRCGVLASSLAGGTFTYGIQVYNNQFLDTSNYSNDNQCGVELAGDGEYSKIHHNIFQGIPSAVRLVDGANSEISFNTCMKMNGDAYDSSYTNGIIYCEDNSNSGKIDILYNKINHNDTGIVAIVCKGDPTKGHNAFKVIGNDILVNSSATNTQAVYFKDAPNSVFKDNKIRGNISSPNDTAVIIEDSDFLIVDSNYIKSFANGIELITSQQVKIGNQNIFEDISTNKFVIDTGSIDVDCETFAFAISGFGVDVAVEDTSPKWMPFDCWLVNYWISAGVAPTGDTLDVGFELNDSSEVSADASIDATENISLTGTNPTLDTNDLVIGDKVMFPITNIGSSTAGQDVTVYMKVIRV